MGWLSNLFKKKGSSSSSSGGGYNMSTFSPKDHYSALMKNCVVEASSDLDKIVKKAKDNIAIYKQIADPYGLPWEIIAVIHNMECGQNFTLGLHCGQRWDRVTTLVPKGRGPFKNFVEAGLDAIQIELNKFPKEKNYWDWLYFLEKYNGTGYLKFHKNVNSPYLWSYTSNYKKGKYTGDGKWDEDAVSKQVGCVPILVRLGFFDGVEL